MRLYTAEAMHEADRRALELGVEGAVLMERAGRAVAEHLMHVLPEANEIVVICGPGNNGGDGYVAARHLHGAGRSVAVFEVRDDPPGDAGAARRAVPAEIVVQPADPARIAARLATADAAIDALFGTGLSRPLEGAMADRVAALNDAAAPVLAVDVPSGVRANLAVPFSVHVRATHTVELAGASLAGVLEPARSAFGRSTVADIGMPPAALEGRHAAELLSAAAAGDRLPGRRRDVHKYRVGTVAVVAGSPRYRGAAVLACHGALRTGAGLVTLVGSARPDGLAPEVVLEPSSDDEAVPSLLALPEHRRGVAVVGCGIAPGDPRIDALPRLLASGERPTVLDAGALDPRHEAAVRDHGACILTPHAGEIGPLLGSDGDEVDPAVDPVGAARRLAAAWSCVVALKGPTTVVAGPDGRIWISTTGHPGMATGGSGDVLAGVLGALVAEAGAAGIPASAASLAPIVAAGAFLHGRAGERAAETHGVGLTPSDLAERLGAARRELAGAPEMRDRPSQDPC